VRLGEFISAVSRFADGRERDGDGWEFEAAPGEPVKHILKHVARGDGKITLRSSPSSLSFPFLVYYLLLLYLNYESNICKPMFHVQFVDLVLFSPLFPFHLDLLPTDPYCDPIILGPMIVGFGDSGTWPLMVDMKFVERCTTSRS